MRILVSIDDTDTMKIEGQDVRGTGELAGMLREAIEQNGWGVCQPITRHQLLVHPDIPYTSHNSAMCFEADIKSPQYQTFLNFAQNFLDCERAPDADPGLCVVDIERISRPGWLIAYGYMAKNCVLTKESAYQLAQSLHIHLSEHGGTGQGVIGALAGAGLRLGGQDGRIKGKLKIIGENRLATAGSICIQGKVDMVKCLDEGIILREDDLVLLGEDIKPVLMHGKIVLPVNLIVGDISTPARYQTYSKQQIKEF